METYRKILTSTKLPDTFSGLIVYCLEDNELVIFCNCGNNSNYLKILISDVIAYQVHEEFCHPNMDVPNNSARPPYSNENKKIYYPALEVVNSIWLNSFSDNRIRDRKKDSKHYYFLSYSNVLDVISDGNCTAIEITQNEYYEAEKFIKNNIA